MNNTAILCFVLGWQGGTVHQVSEVLGFSVSTILDANESELGMLCRKAQKARWTSTQAQPPAKLRPAQIADIIKENMGVIAESWQGSHVNGDDIPKAARAVHELIYGSGQ